MCSWPESTRTFVLRCVMSSLRPLPGVQSGAGLLTLPAAVIASYIWPFLILKQHIGELSHVCRMLPPLSPATYCGAALHLDAASCIYLSMSSARWTDLLSGVSSITVAALTELDVHRGWSNTQLLESVIRLLSGDGASRFANLQILSLYVDNDNTSDIRVNSVGATVPTRGSLLSRLIFSPAAFPILHTLSIAPARRCHGVGDPVCLLSWECVSCLRSLPSLSRLRLQATLLEGCFAPLLDLPLDHLDLAGSVIVHGGQGACHAVNAANLTCRSLRLPSRCPAAPELAFSIIDRVLQQYATAAAHEPSLRESTRCGRLEELHFHDDLAMDSWCVFPTQTLSYAAAISSLTAVHLPSAVREEELVHLFTSLCQHGLLPNLHTISFRLTVFTVQLHPSFPAFLHQFGSQLRHVDLLELDLAQSCSEQLLQCLWGCSQLRSMSLTTGQRSLSVPPLILVLPQLHSLRLRGEKVTDAQLVALLPACPALQYLCIEGCKTTITVLPVLGRHCRLLQSLWMESLASNLFNDREAVDGIVAMAMAPTTTASPNQCLFRALRSVHIDFSPGLYDSFYDDERAASPAALFDALTVLFRAAPIHRMHLALACTADRLQAFAGFPSLRSLVLLRHSDVSLLTPSTGRQLAIDASCCHAAGATPWYDGQGDWHGRSADGKEQQENVAPHLIQYTVHEGCFNEVGGTLPAGKEAGLQTSRRPSFSRLAKSRKQRSDVLCAEHNKSCRA